MDISRELPQLRFEAESMMTDYCFVVRAPETDPDDPPPVLDPATGLYPDVADEIVYDGPCSVRIPGTLSTGKARPSAGDSASLQSAIFSVPWSAPRLLVRDRVVFASSTYNPALVGLVYSVTGLLPGSQITKQRVTIEAVID